MIAMQVAEDRLQLYNPLAVERHHHAEHPVGRGVVGPHGHLEKVPVELVAHGAHVGSSRRQQRGLVQGAHGFAPSGGEGDDGAGSGFFTLARRSPWGVGSHSLSSGST